MNAEPQPPTGLYARFKAAVKQLKRDVLALYYAVHDPRTPFLSKLLPWLVLAYALSPLDLIPDFIPVLGFLDDMLLLPLGLWLSYKLIPAEVREGDKSDFASARERGVCCDAQGSKSGWLLLAYALWLQDLTVDVIPVLVF